MPFNGFIVDFCCLDGKLVVELDGGQHGSRTVQDKVRTQNLKSSGYLVLRFWNNDVLKNIDGVLETILNTLPHTPEPPHPNPLPHSVSKTRVNALVGERERT
jgi:very-short-patch-repair endonuclease